MSKILYKASAIILTCVNIIMFISDMTIVTRDINILLLNFYDYYYTFTLSHTFLPVKVFSFAMLGIETLLIYFNTHGDNTDNVRNKKRYKIAHAFALGQIIWFGHRLVTDAIISIVFFGIAPAQTLGVVTLLLSVIASAIALVAVVT